MNIYEYAMQMEKDGEQYYRELAGKTDNKGLKSILTMLAEAEVLHYRIFHKMKDHEKIHMTDTPILNDVKNIFLQMKESKETAGADNTGIALYKKAQDIEKKSMEFYSEKAEAAGDAEQKKIFLKIADEEKKHYAILEHIIGFVSRPEQWLEDAEWYHIEEY